MTQGGGCRRPRTLWDTPRRCVGFEVYAPTSNTFTTLGRTVRRQVAITWE